jgi:hypothetical protein
MPLNVTDVADQLQETNHRLTKSNERLTTAIHGLEVEVAKINTSLAFGGWIGVAMLAISLGLLAFSFTAMRKATQIEADVASLKKDSEELKSAVFALQKDSAELRNDFKVRDDRFMKALAELKERLPAPR